eukprot:s860_g25.t1
MNWLLNARLEGLWRNARQALAGRVNVLEATMKHMKEQEEVQKMQEPSSSPEVSSVPKVTLPSNASPAPMSSASTVPVPASSGFPVHAAGAHWTSAYPATGVQGPQLAARAYLPVPRPKPKPPLPPTMQQPPAMQQPPIMQSPPVVHQPPVMHQPPAMQQSPACAAHDQRLAAALYESLWDEWEDSPNDASQPQQGSARPGETMAPPAEISPGESGRRSALRRTVPVPERTLPPELLTPEATARRMLNGLDLLDHIRSSLDSIKRLHDNLCAFAAHQVDLQNSMIDAIEHLGTTTGVFMPAPGGSVPGPGPVYHTPPMHIPQTMPRSTASASNPS